MREPKRWKNPTFALRAKAKREGVNHGLFLAVGVLEQQLCDDPDCNESYGHSVCQALKELINEIEEKRWV